MPNSLFYVAADFGASGGRIMLGEYNGRNLRLEEVHRFANEPVMLGKTLYWDFLRLLLEFKRGLTLTGIRRKNISSIGIDTWGVDYGLLDRRDELIGNPYHYRDQRTENIGREITDNFISWEKLYAKTGVQYLPFNTLFQLYADKKYRGSLLEQAESLLFLPDLFAFYLTGHKYNEYTVASTSQLLNAGTAGWDPDLLQAVGLPGKILQTLIRPGQVTGILTRAVQAETGLGAVPVIAVGSHDTASAVAATPLATAQSAYLSCGTWSLLGVERDRPLMNALSRQNNFTNEGGVEGKIRFLKNVTGLWIIQQLRKHWTENGEEIGFPAISKQAAAAKNNRFVIDPDADVFRAPADMAAAIRDYCGDHGQGIPRTIGELAIAAYHGITGQYKQVIDGLEAILGYRIDAIHMVGGGIQDGFLCQLTADVTGKTVLAGPVEASVLGNILLQLIAAGEVKNLAEGRELIQRSFGTQEYSPQPRE
ncbi:Hypothetical protein LUCI_1833 [Lucifera butyrica]|uniref:Rhamnulokinase n=1 Tax=Lucifera butyrica TaxID=1351585 RepID=A0A498R6T3_9FIRM|nr:rhamnulokinase family protein [Lucifera butyrica]VBB06597.1 Hypothetical protein LUCI_1833 [Lucifera butyrica]